MVTNKEHLRNIRQIERSVQAIIAQLRKAGVIVNDQKSAKPSKPKTKRKKWK
jgi:hypothetical protein